MNNGNGPRDLDAPALPSNSMTVPRAGGVAQAHVDPMGELARMIAEPPRVPQIGLMASEAMMRGFEQYAAEIEKVAQEGVERALAVQQEAVSFASVIRASGRLLCDKIEGEAVVINKLLLMVRDGRETFMASRPPEQ